MIIPSILGSIIPELIINPARGLIYTAQMMLLQNPRMFNSGKGSLGKLGNLQFLRLATRSLSEWIYLGLSPSNAQFC
jgi:hypothetical protein